MPYVRDLFISHSWNYSDYYDKFLDLIDKDSSFYYRDKSVPKDDPIHTSGSDDELYNAIKKRIAGSHVIIIMAGVYSTYSDWIGREIDICKNEFVIPKPIIAVEPWGSERTSSIVKENADRIVKWSSSSIIKAIREVS